VEALDHDRYKVTLGEYASGVIVLGDSYPEHPEPRPADLKNERPFSLDIPTCYRDNWLFHGVRYQGLKSFDAMADNGIRGQLTSLSAKGGLLDNAGQIYGMWIATKDDVGRIAMPLRIRSVAFFEPEPKPGETVECRTWIRQANNNLVSADLDLLYEGRVCTRIEAWDDWLFETRGRLYQVYRFPHKSLLAEPHPAGFTVVQDPGWLSTTLDFLTKRYLSVRERAKNPGVDGSRHFTEWLCGRIAAKDAVRRLLFEGGRESMYPAEIEITSDEEGRPLVATSTGRDIRVSLAHKKGIAVAIAAEGQTPGIDVEHVEPRSDAFNAMSFHPEELAMIPEQDRDVWLTRLWCAKEAVGKATGQGLAGNPKTLRVHRIENDSLLVEERWVDTDVLGEFVVAWVRQ
jgi:phosphopantetheinyl transferase